MRNKSRQLSFLHTYHHLTIFVFFWFGLWFAPVGSSWIAPFVNCFVHVVMYSYYGLTSLGWDFGRRKRYITKMQLLQFVFLAYQGVYILFRPECGFPVWMLKVYVPYVLGFLALFAQFYYAAFQTAKAKRKLSSSKGATPSKGKAESKSQDTSPAYTRSRARQSKKSQ